MRLSGVLVPAIVVLVAALLSVIGARSAVSVVEDRSALGVQEALADDGLGWAAVLADGLQVILEGEAPSEALRFRAMTVAGTVVDASRVIDNMSVTRTAEIAPPEFAVEILRNDGGISLIGLIPATTDRETLIDRITAIAGELPVIDLLETADYPMPDDWRPTMSYALLALEELPRSKISVMAGAVEITAISRSGEERRRLESTLTRSAPDEVRVALDISAPRPVITPFTTRFVLDADGARFDACAADTPQAADAILAAARAAGLDGKGSCTVGLGVPSATWSDAVQQSIEAVAALGGGTVTLSDADISLVALEGTDQALFDEVVGELQNGLPDLFDLEAVLPVAPTVTEEGPPRFTVTLSPEGLVQLRGRVSDELLNITAENFARARFSNADVDMGTRIADGLPEDWSIRVLAGIEALSNLSNGAVVVEPAALSVRGNSGNEEAEGEISRLLIEKLGQSADFTVEVAYVPQLDPIAGLPTPEECLEQIFIVTENRKITFDPGSATISASAQAIMDDIAEILKICPDLPIRIAGYTDSQGRESMNQQLSQQRAESVLTALRVRRVPTSSFEAVGFGEADPIADNDTEEGREANRRIEFSLIEPEPVEEVETGLEAIEAPLDGDAAEGGEGTEGQDE